MTDGGASGNPGLPWELIEDNVSKEKKNRKVLTIRIPACLRFIKVTIIIRLIITVFYRIGVKARQAGKSMDRS
jgi:hypothetical protein